MRICTQRGRAPTFPPLKSLVYVILGAAGSGRREIVADLIEGGLDGDDRPAVLLPAGEPAAGVDPRLGMVGSWSWADGRIEAAPPAGASHVFVLADGRRNPVDQLEALVPWLATAGAELGRILCVIDCGLAAEHKELFGWFDACVHFSDVVLFTRREGLPNKWFSDFRARFASQFLPCLFENVKAGRVSNPALVLEAQARRLSHAVDAAQDWLVSGSEDEAPEGEAEVTAEPEVDPYFQRRPGGRRVKEIPDIAPFVEGR